jgi:hypothetical protein
VLKAVHDGKAFVDNTDRWSDVLRPRNPKAAKADKVKIAREVVRRWQSGLDYLDLHKQVIALAQLIEAANGRQSSNAGSVVKSIPVVCDPQSLQP